VEKLDKVKKNTQPSASVYDFFNGMVIHQGGVMLKKIGSCTLLSLFFIFLPKALDASALTIRLYGGGTYLQGGDLNSGLKGWTDYWKAYYGKYGYPEQTGLFNPVHFGYHAGGDIIIHLTSRFGLGVGAEYITATKSSDLTFLSSNADITWKIVGKPSALPIKLSFFYFLPLGNSVSISLHGGAGYYQARTRLESHFQTTTTLTDYLIDASAKGIGYHGGLGLEWKLFSKLYFLLEAAGRYAPLSGFKGDTTIVGQGGWKGKIYYWGAKASFIDNFNYIDLLISAPGGTGFTFVREAKIDYSGFSLQAGFVIKL
jgi:hypothetical protein